MPNTLLPVAVGVAATIALPLQAHATDAMLDDVPPIADATQSTPADIPVSKQSAYAEASGALNFEPVWGQGATARTERANTATRQVMPPQSAKASDATRSDDARTQVKRDFGGAKPIAAKEHLFEGGSESLVARTVGAAEGTRSVDGGKTPNYYGHVDPGNGVWNRGTFSYQFGNSENLSPDAADRRQLAKIKRIYESVMLPKAEQYGVHPLTLEEEINGIDLINQAPLTVTESGGYIERLAEAKQKGLTGDEAILSARIWSFWDDGKGGWDAPGLRAYDDISKQESIRRDQDRRMAMIAEALAAYRAKYGDIARLSSSGSTSSATPKTATRDTIANTIIFAEKPVTRG